jgi:lipoic acid synthetase
MSRTFPPWLKKRIPAEGTTETVRALLDELGLTTVCQNARCPNIMECFTRKTATFMILGNVCCRNCGFCAVPHGSPKPLDPEEPKHVAEAVQRLKLRHAVITSVTRDDLPDGGAGHFAATIRAIREIAPNTIVEVLTPDFQGTAAHIRTVIAARPNIYNHNVETVPRMYPVVRPQANYRRSLELLALVKTEAVKIYRKSGLMVGIGETDDEIYAVIKDLRWVGCGILTIGQYLRPSPDHLPIARFVHPDTFAAYEKAARAAGFLAVASGPFVRSSYNAEHVFQQIQ